MTSHHCRGMAVVAAATAWLAGCGTFRDVPPGAESVFAIFQPPSYSEAAEWALDEFNADNRYRGLVILADAPFAGEAVYVRLYRERLRDPDSGVRQAAVRALGMHGEPEDVPVIAALLDDPDELTRGEAARALQKLHNPAVIDALIQRTRPEVEREAEVRTEAARALGQYPRRAVLQGLIATLQDRSLAVNRAGVESLETLTGQNFGLDTRRWLAWIESQDDPFRAGRRYTYPGFQRPRHPVEWLPLPFIPPPPNMPDAPPVGLPRGEG